MPRPWPPTAPSPWEILPCCPEKLFTNLPFHFHSFSCVRALSHVPLLPWLLSTFRNITILVWGCTVTLVFSPIPAVATILPEQVIIVVNENLPESVALGTYYAQQRSIPHDHIIPLSLPDKETIRSNIYRNSLLIPLKDAITQRGLASQVKVIVTTYGVPLRIKRPKLSRVEKVWKADAESWLNAGMDYLHSLREDLTKLETFSVSNGSSPKTRSLVSHPPNKKGPLRKQSDLLIAEIERALSQGQNDLLHNEDPATREFKEKALLKIQRQYQGYLTTISQNGMQQIGATQDFSPALNSPRLKKNLHIAWKLLTLQHHQPTPQSREWAYKIAQGLFGIKGVIQLAQSELTHLAFEDAESSVDGELSLLWWFPDFYEREGRFPNPLHHERLSGNHSPSLELPILMVSRIDGPTPAIAKHMIDMAISAEHGSLRGKIYIDARGKKPGNPGSYGYYDEDLRHTATLFQDQTSYPVILENTKRRFSTPGEAPDVGIYVGWYRLRHYEDAFQFNPGAIGYHIASGEAVSLHTPSERGWCKNALEKGLTVTLGSTSEPYLDAFPPPSEFYGLLLSGHYSLVEAYYLTTRYLSWHMVLLGDPLYNPWKSQPGITPSTLLQYVPQLEYSKSLPPPPSQLTFRDPISTANKARTQRKTFLQQFSSLANRLP
ncbi:MAG: TIGR03790 family protein [Nitrospirae bacterium]|nr:TIGR03790 family protein [Nitrospirota bacterium]